MGEPISEKMEYGIISNLTENIGIHSTNKIDIFYTTHQTTA